LLLSRNSQNTTAQHSLCRVSAYAKYFSHSTLLSPALRASDCIFCHLGKMRRSVFASIAWQVYFRFLRLGRIYNAISIHRPLCHGQKVLELFKITRHHIQLTDKQTLDKSCTSQKIHPFSFKSKCVSVACVLGLLQTEPIVPSSPVSHTCRHIIPNRALPVPVSRIGIKV